MYAGVTAPNVASDAADEVAKANGALAGALRTGGAADGGGDRRDGARPLTFLEVVAYWKVDIAANPTDVLLHVA
jgi:hypothetical protein